MGVATNDVVVAADGKSKLVREIQEEERAAARGGGEEKGQSSGGIRFGRIDHATTGSKDKVRETDLNEVQRTVQVLCQSTNPIAKCMDYVHEDVATMHAELKKWEQELKLQVSQLEQEVEFTRAFKAVSRRAIASSSLSLLSNADFIVWSAWTSSVSRADTSFAASSATAFFAAASTSDAS